MARFEGPLLPKKIRALASYRDYTFAAYGNDIGVFKRTHQVATWSGHNAKVNLLLLFGEHILSVDVQGNLFKWAFKGIEKNLCTVGPILLGSESAPTCIMHSPTYLNKVLIGNQDGSLHLWNTSTKKKIYKFKGWKSPVHCCVSSPNEKNVVAVGCADGKIHVHNVRSNRKKVTLCQSTRGAVTALSFRTDGQPLLASGSSSGVICIWDYNKGRLQSVIRNAHDGSVISLHFFANEPVLMSTSADNSIKTWIFDTTDGDARLLRFLSGHSKPPLCIRFYANGRHILSAGQDRAFRLFSVVQDQQSRELSQRHVTKRAKKLKLKEEEIKLKPVIAFDVADIRERDWSNVVTCHMDTPHAYVWRLQNFSLGEHILKPTTNIQAPIKACTISSCGNFAILGTASGWIEKFNLESGMSRGSYVDILEKGYSAHGGEVVGVACDSKNSLLISAGYHGDIKVWSFEEGKRISKWEVGCTVVKIVYHRSNGLLAVVTDDLVIRIFDVVTRKLVRKFEGHTDRITDICFSEDGKWVMSSSMDGTLRIWDVILARQIDEKHVDVPITSLSLSPNMDVLATTHVDQNGVHLWVNQTMFSGVTHINFQLQSQPITDSPLLDQQIPVLVTLSLLPKRQWQSLINLDTIKARNKPIEPPKKPENTPFFLPSIPSLSGEIAFKVSEPTNEEKPAQRYRTTEPSSPFVQFLHSSVEMKTFDAFTKYLKSLSSSTLEMELRMLQIIDNDDDDDEEPEKRPELTILERLLDYFINEVSGRNNFEFIQALIRLFLKIHGETVRRQSRLQAKAQKLLEAQSPVWQKLDGLFQNTRCMVTFISNSQF